VSSLLTDTPPLDIAPLSLHDALPISSINFVVPDDPLMSGGMGQVQLRNYTDSPYGHELATAAAAAAVALQTWTGLPQQNIWNIRSEEHTSELQSRFDLVCRLLLEKTK